jgi:phytoene dehydrogenase-like protein
MSTHRRTGTPLWHSRSAVRRSRRHCAGLAAQASAAQAERQAAGGQETATEVVVIGSGIGGLSCAALLAKYGVKVLVLESHDIPGGAAHSWVQKGYHFESGPSLYSDMASTGRAANPLAQVLQAIGEPLDLIEYNTWNILVPEGEYLTEIGNDQFEEVLIKVRGPDGPEAVRQWKHLQEFMRPLAKAATMLPPTAFRFDPGAAVTVFARYLPQILTGGTDGLKLLGSFKKVLDEDGSITDPFIRNYLDLLCFLLSGLPSDGTIAAEVAFMFNTWFKPGAQLEFPVGGSQAMVNALVRGVKKHGGKIQLRSHVEEVLIEGGRAVGVRLKNGRTIRATKAVVSNASMWNTLDLLPAAAVPAGYRRQVQQTPANRSFMHLHLGFDGAGLPEDLELHHIVVNDWEPAVDSEQNVVLISIPSVKDPKLAPAGKHTLHAYLPATEPFAIWQDLERGSPEYEKLKEERSQVMWRAVERIIPDIRQRCEITMVGTPLTHRHFLRRAYGTYGPGIKAGEGTFPGPKTPIPGLLCCGDSTFPGIGLPAVAASGAVAANSLVSPWKHWALLDELKT